MARIHQPGEEWTTVEWKLDFRFPFLHRVVTKHKMDDLLLAAWDAIDPNKSVVKVFNSDVGSIPPGSGEVKP